MGRQNKDIFDLRWFVAYHTHDAADVGIANVKLDDLATPDDNTDLNATTGHHGLLPKLAGGTSNFLRADGAWAAPAGGAGTGNSIYTGAYADIPDPTAVSVGDLYLPSDRTSVKRNTGVAWQSWGPLYPITEVPTTGWTWDHQNGATATFRGGAGVTLALPKNTSNISAIYRSLAAATPYTITTMVLPQIMHVDVHSCGLMFKGKDQAARLWSILLKVSPQD